jgi:hypothetical protein
MTPAGIEQRSTPEPNSGCWLWDGCPDEYGYGRVRERGKLYRAHRKSWEVNVGLIPDGKCVLHRCDVTLCVNPAHLFLGSHIENMADMSAKKRARPRGLPLGSPGMRGETHKCHKLTEKDVLEIRKLTGSMTRIARVYGVSLSTISNIKLRKKWAWL